MSGPAKTSSWQQTYIYGTFYICFFGLFVPSKLLWSFLRALRLLFTCLKTDSGCCAGDMPYSCPICGLESHINPIICSEFFDRTVVSGRQLPGRALSPPPLPCGLWELSLIRLDILIQYNTSIHVKNYCQLPYHIPMYLCI